MHFISIMAAMILVIIIILFTRNLIKGRVYRQICSHVIEVEVSQRIDPTSHQSYTAYVPIYEYEVDEKKYTARGSASRDVPMYSVGDTRVIIYNSNNPEEVHLRKGIKHKTPIGLAFIVLGIILVVVAFLVG